MEDFFAYICENAAYAPFVLVGLLFLAGLNIPISEDLLLLTAGTLASRCIPDSFYTLYFSMYIGCCVSGWETYALGRVFGVKLYNVKWFKHIVTPQRIENLHYYYEKYGIWTFIVGRFIPGGARNALYITSGMGKMPFALFAMRDGVAALFSTSVMFYIGYIFGENYEWIMAEFIHYDRIAALVFMAIIVFLGIWTWKTAKS